MNLIEQAYAIYDSDPRVSGPDDYEAFREAVGPIVGENERLRKALEIARPAHTVVEGDCWFSCPASGECCNDAYPENKCNCGADIINAQIDEVLGITKAQEATNE